MAVQNGKAGFWGKRPQDTAPVFFEIGNVGPNGNAVDATGQPLDIEAFKQRWLTTVPGAWAGENPSGYTPGKSGIDNATGGVTPFTGAKPDTVADTYFDVMLKDIESQAATGRQRVDQSFNTFVKHLKEDRQLFDEDLTRTYAKSLEKINENAYNRGVQQSGIRTKAFGEASTEKTFQEKQRNVTEAQKQEIANTDRQQRLEDIAASERRARASLKSPYASFQY